jgi:type II secretory pathway pseudopilin PulG
MSFVTTALVVSAVTSVASGAMAFYGAQQQAKAQEQQAKQAQLLAANRAQIERNNAQGRAQDEQFQSGVADFNKQETLIETNRQADLADKQIAASLASQQSKAGRAGLAGGSFEDILNAESLKLEQEESQLLYKGGQQAYEFSKSSELGDLRGKRAIEMGKYSSQLALAEGRYQSSNLKAQAKATSIGGYASLAGGIAQGAGTASQIEV